MINYGMKVEVRNESYFAALARIKGIDELDTHVVYENGERKILVSQFVYNRIVNEVPSKRGAK